MTTPVDELMVFPPARLAASRLYVTAVEFVDVAVYVTVPADWQRDDVLPVENTGVPTVGLASAEW